jgi:hypothetical protein
VIRQKAEAFDERLGDSALIEIPSEFGHSGVNSMTDEILVAMRTSDFLW